jgi:Chromo (CHRromatin Organisation MOdifier) domain
MLEPSVPNSIPEQTQSPPLPVKIDGKAEYEISEILDSKTDRHRRPCNLLYLVRWTGYEGTDEETSWVFATELGHAAEIVTDFHSAYPAKPGPWARSAPSRFSLIHYMDYFLVNSHTPLLCLLLAVLPNLSTLVCFSILDLSQFSLIPIPNSRNPETRNKNH